MNCRSFDLITTNHVESVTHPARLINLLTCYVSWSTYFEQLSFLGGLHELSLKFGDFLCRLVLDLHQPGVQLQHRRCWCHRCQHQERPLPHSLFNDSPVCCVPAGRPRGPTSLLCSQHPPAELPHPTHCPGRPGSAPAASRSPSASDANAHRHRQQQHPWNKSLCLERVTMIT